LKTEAKSHILNHDNVVKLYAMVFEQGHYGVVLEYVPHGDLADFIFRKKVRLTLLSSTIGAAERCVDTKIGKYIP